MAPKDESELRTLQKACSATCEVFSKYLKSQIMEVIDADKVGVTFLEEWESWGFCGRELGS